MRDDDLPVLNEVVREGDESVIRSTRFGHAVATAGGSLVGTPAHHRAVAAARGDDGPSPVFEAITALGGAIGIDASRDVAGTRVSRLLGELIDLHDPDPDGVRPAEPPRAEALDDDFDDTLAITTPPSAAPGGQPAPLAATPSTMPDDEGVATLEHRVDALVERHVEALRRELRTLLAEAAAGGAATNAPD